ncbi:Panacea domain-containing protein [Trichocoleus sp. FACHB-262]|uniref:Panacea domain-containing protein n=1 Tax=Trichocoleus sp. FACHB-262 TaxID=2692869 RepID=UPI001687C3A8|nr:type II toxin-antitoxin system antitoxin SocA domain-containing protein [Trichocoleus sp. FACHB-262]MBD2123415.1 SocA family protein [Trichocoleus sp. FACHB-262]
MATALEVAHYFLNKVDREAGDAITSLRLQKLIYYAQAWSMVFRHQPLFEEQVQAWKDGPAVYSVWKRYKQYERDAIPQETVTMERGFQPDELQLLDIVWEIYGELSASQLWKLTHSELPWIEARQGLAPSESSQNPISLQDMKNYYEDFGSFSKGNPFIEKEVTEVNKEKTVIRICLKNGSQEEIELKDLGTYIAENSQNIQYEQSELPVEGIDLLF